MASAWPPIEVPSECRRSGPAGGVAAWPVPRARIACPQGRGGAIVRSGATDRLTAGPAAAGGGQPPGARQHWIRAALIGVEVAVNDALDRRRSRRRSAIPPLPIGCTAGRRSITIGFGPAGAGDGSGRGGSTAAFPATPTHRCDALPREPDWAFYVLLFAYRSRGGRRCRSMAASRRERSAGSTMFEVGVRPPPARRPVRLWLLRRHPPLGAARSAAACSPAMSEWRCGDHGSGSDAT